MKVLSVKLLSKSGLKKCKDTEIIFFSSTTKTATNHKLGLEKAFQEILHSIER